MYGPRQWRNRYGKNRIFTFFYASIRIFENAKFLINLLIYQNKFTFSTTSAIIEIENDNANGIAWGQRQFKQRDF